MCNKSNILNSLSEDSSLLGCYVRMVNTDGRFEGF